MTRMDSPPRFTEEQQLQQHQRFSWQPPPDEETSYYTNRPQQQTPVRLLSQPHISTDVPSQRHFSYAQTPTEHLAFVYTSSASDPPMPQPRPMSYTNTRCTPIEFCSQPMLPGSVVHALQSVPTHSPPAYFRDEKTPVSPTSEHSDFQVAPFSPVSPMPPQPAMLAIDTQRSRHARQMSNLSPINTDLRAPLVLPIPSTPLSDFQTSPLPYKTPITPISASVDRGHPAQSSSITPLDRRSCANEPYSPHGFSSGQTNNAHAVFSPDAAHGPNGLDFALHQPGQITHPNMDSHNSPVWTHSICACSPDIATCTTGLLCPCILYGRTSYRLSQRSAKKDPTDMLGYSATNGHCMMMSLLCGFWWLFPMLQRTRIRHSYKIGGSLASDLLQGGCCCCCVAVQNEREVKSREEASRRWAGPASSDVYTKVNGMVYKPQQ
ncbi:hypothetical protein ACN47E_002037 [Coniothyrium glycines]